MSLANPTLDDIWKLFQETDRKFQETDRKIDNLSQQLSKEISNVNESLSKKISNVNESLSKEISKVSENLSKEIERVSKEVDKVSKEVSKVSTNLGRLGNKLGDFIEEMVHPAAVRLFQERGIDVHEVHRNITSTRDGEGIEVDLLVVNDTDIIAIECKSTLGIDDVNEHLERLEKLKRLLPAYNTKKVMGAVTAMIIPENVAQYAYRQGLYVIGQTGNQLVVRNDLKFKAKFW